MSRQAIQAQAEALKVPYLLHFTRASNLPSIMAHGLYPIARVGEAGVAPAVNDHRRLDYRTDGTCMSIAFPNSRMFYKYRKECVDAGIAMDWAVLVIHPSVLWVKDCAFCQHNAADARISGEQLAVLKTPQAFAGMFEEIEGVESREAQKLKPCDPTDVQAEILVFDVVEPQYIIGVIFDSSAGRDTYTPHLGGRKTYVHANDKGIYASRGYARKYG